MRKFLKVLFTIIILFFTSFNIYSFKWPFGRAIDYVDEGPQKITSTYGEYREGGGTVGSYFEYEHFHDGVDIVPLSGVPSTIYSVSNTTVWKTNEEYHYILTTWQDYRHVETPFAVDVNDLVNTDTVLSEWGYQLSWAHLHFSNRLYSDTTPYYSNNPLDPDFIYPNRFEELCEDYNDPSIIDIFITLDGDDEYKELNPNNIPENTDVDIIVKAEENTTYPEGIDLHNGVFKIKYNFDYEWEYRDSFLFDSMPLHWDIYYVYDTARSHTDPFGEYYYIITNKMDANGSYNTGPGGNWHTVFIVVEDEQGNDMGDFLEFYVSSSGVDEKKPGKFALSVNNLNAPSLTTEINYSLPKKSKVDLNIYDSMGRVVNTLVNKEQKAGIYTVKWNGKNKLNNTLPNGTYFCNLKAGDFNDSKKIVRLNH